jgi:glucose/arabinose dehydrogenase
VHYNPKGKQATRLAEYELAPSRLGREPAREKRVLFEWKQPYPNHNGGELAFGPDGKLYLGLGDGGSANDPHNYGQDLSQPLGKLLRFDVDGPALVPPDNPFVGRPGVRPEIFAYGLRNPWKISFAPDGRLIVADVGQDKYEEIDLVEKGDNLGWRRREAAHCFRPPVFCGEEGLVDPIFEYSHQLGASITGGYVYTGSALPSLRGKYLFTDFISGRLWALDLPRTRGERASARVLSVFPIQAATFGRDPQGELYLGDYPSGKLYQLVPRTGSAAR